MSKRRQRPCILCDCGNRAFKLVDNQPVCERCDRIEREMHNYVHPNGWQKNRDDETRGAELREAVR